jgi:hypothetical protein
MFNRMFASFVERKVHGRPSGSGGAPRHSNPPSSGYPAPQPPPSGPPPPSQSLLRRTASAHPRALPPGHPHHQGPPQHSGPPPQGYHHRSSHHAGHPASGGNPAGSSNAAGPPGAGSSSTQPTGVNRSLASLLSPANAPPPTGLPPSSSAARNRSRDVARGSLAGGSNASDEASGAHPPPKRTRTSATPANALSRTRSAHVPASSSGGGVQWQPPSSSRAPAPSGSGGSGAATPAESGRFKCEDCTSVFGQKGQLLRHHRRVHEKLRPHACEHCGRLFGARSDRSRHVLVREKWVLGIVCVVVCISEVISNWRVLLVALFVCMCFSFYSSRCVYCRWVMTDRSQNSACYNLVWFVGSSGSCSETRTSHVVFRISELTCCLLR